MMSYEKVDEVSLAASNYRCIRQYLYEKKPSLAAATDEQRSSTRTKLTLMSSRQFLELSTDVRDEINRRCMKGNENEYPDEDKPPRSELAAVPFLPIQKELHHQRNQGRQKLAKLPEVCFKDLASDVLYELDRRYPQLRAQEYGDNKSQDQFYSNESAVYSREGDQYSNNSTSLAASTKSDIQQTQTIYNASSSTNVRNNSDRETDKQSYGKSNSIGSDISKQKPVFIGLNSSWDARDAPNNSTEPINNTTYKSILKSSNAGLANDSGETQNNDSKIKQGDYLNDIYEELDKVKMAVSSLEKLANVQGKVNPNIMDMVYQVEAGVTSTREKCNQLADDIKTIQSSLSSFTLKFEEVFKVISSLQNKNSFFENKLTILEKQLASFTHNLKGPIEAPSGSKSNSEPVSNMYSDLSECLNLFDNFISESNSNFPINKELIVSYREAVRSILAASKSNVPSNSIIVSVKSIVTSCRRIIESLEDINPGNKSNAMPSNSPEIETTKRNVMELLTHLIKIAKSCAVKISKTEIDSIYLTVFELTKVVQILISRLPSVPTNNRIKPPTPVQTSNIPNQQLPETSKINKPPGDTDDEVFSELKRFLEKQAESIVKALHTLLSEMRSSKSIDPQFSKTIDKIVLIVDKLINIFRSSFSQPRMADLSQSVDPCLAEFSKAKIKFNEAGRAVMRDPSSADNRRQLARSSYLIAKFVKELITLIE